MQKKHLKNFLTSKFAKFIFGIIAIAFFALIQLSGQGFSLSTVKALSSFNTDPQDRETLRSSNYTQFPNSTSNWNTVTYADAGDIVSLGVYYHNSANEVAENVRISIGVPSASGTNLIASGSVSADNFEASSGQTEIIISSDQTLTYIPGSTTWYPNQSLNAGSIPFGQSGDEIVTSGLNIGDISSGWSSQGSVVARFQVSNNSSIPPKTASSSLDVTANGSQGPVTLSQGESFTVDWISANVTNCSVLMDGVSLSGVLANGSMGPITASHPFYPAQGTSVTFTIECSGLSSLISDSVVVSNPSQGNPPVLPETPSLSVSTGNSCGGSIELSWGAVAGATSYKIFRGGVQILETQNTSHTDTGLVPNTAYFYTIRASNSVGDSPESASTGTLSSTNCTTPQSSVDVTANGSQGPVTLSQGESFTVDWISANVTNCFVSVAGLFNTGVASNGSLGPIDPNHSFYPPAGGSNVFVINCTGLNGNVTDYVEVNRPQIVLPPPTAPTLSALTESTCGGNILLNWNIVSGATSYEVFRDGVKVTTISGTSYIDSGLTGGSSHSYFVKSVGPTGVSVSSNIVTATASADCPIPQSSVDVTANGSQGPVTLSQGESFTVDWISANVTNCFVSVAGLFNTGVASNGSLGPIDPNHSFYPSAGGSNEFVIICDGLNGQVTDTVIVNRPNVILPPPSPTITASTSSTCGGEIVLSWNVVSGATEYKVFRNNSQIATLVGATSYTDTGLTSGQSYTYTVKAINSAGQSPFSNSASATASDPCESAPNAPTISAITDSTCGGNILLSWNAVSGATSYKIFRDNIQVASTANTSYTDAGLTPDTLFTYKVKAVNDIGNSPFSNSVSALSSPACAVLPNAPVITVTTGTACGGTALVSWSQIQNAASYNVYRDGSLIASTFDISYTDTGLTSGQSYTYTVKAINSAGQSPFSNSASATASENCITVPIAPTLSGSSGQCGGEVDLSWTNISNATSYKVFRDTVQIAVTSSTTYVDKGITPDSIHLYTVRAVNTAGESIDSNTVNMRASGLCPLEDPQVSLTANPTTIFKGQNSTLSWTSLNTSSCSALWTTSTAVSGSQVVNPEITTTYSITCEKGTKTVTDTVTVTVVEAPICHLPEIDSQLKVSAKVGDNFSYTLTASSTGTSTISYSIATSSLPAGLSVNQNVISGIPTVSGSFSIEVKATNECGVDSENLIIVVSPKDNPPVDPKPTVDLDANPTTIFKGQNSTLSWTSTNSNSCSALWTTATSTSGSQVVSPETTTTYSITCEKGINSVTDTVTVTVVEEPICELPSVTSPLSVSGKVGDTFSYVFSVNQSGTSTAYTLATSSLPAGLVFADDSISGVPTVSGTFSIEFTATNECGTANDVLTIIISPADNGGGDPNPTVKINANPLTIFTGATTTLTWASTNANSCSALWTTATSTSGSQVVSPATTTTYSITCEGGTKTATDAVTVTVDIIPSPIPSVKLLADPQSIIRGNSSSLSWISSNVSSCSAPWTTATSTSGTQLVSPTDTTSYEIVCTGTFGNATSSAIVTVSEPSSGGGGGGGGSSRRVSRTPQVLGDEVSCEYLKDYLRIDWINDPVEVIKLQVFLKELEGFSDLQVTRIFDQATFDAVAIFQERYFDDILRPWGHDRYTGFVYILTKKKVNEIFCQRAFPLNNSQEQEIIEFRAFIESLKSQGISVPELGEENTSNEVDTDTLDTGSIIPGIVGSIQDVLDRIEGNKDDSVESNGLFGNRDIRAVAGAVFAGPQGTSASLQAIVIFLLSLLASYVLSRLTANIWKAKYSSPEIERMRKIASFTLGLVLVIILCFILEYYAIVLPTLVLIIILSCAFLWLALTKPKMEFPMIEGKIEEKEEDTHSLS